MLLTQSKNYALQFDSVDDYVAISHSFPNQTTDFSITGWIKGYNVFEGNQRIFVDDQNTYLPNGGGYGFSLNDGGPGQLRFFSRGTEPVSLDVPPSAALANNIGTMLPASLMFHIG